MSGNLYRVNVTTGQRLDHAVAVAAGVSHQRARKLIAGGSVTLNGRRVQLGDKGDRLTMGDRIEVHGSLGRIVPTPDMPLEVLAEGSDYLIINKPAGVAVHPLLDHETGTLLNAVVARYPQVQGVGNEGGLRSGVVHRLDIDTSGVMLVALTGPAWGRFRRAFSEHTIEKDYLALVAGHPTEQGEVDLLLAVTRHKPAYVSVVGPEYLGARSCTMAWQVRERFAGASLVDIRLGTGFLHQIRASMAHLGHPVLGDTNYGGPAAEFADAPRQMLHARHLRLGDIEASCEPPDDFMDTLQRLNETPTALPS